MGGKGTEAWSDGEKPNPETSKEGNSDQENGAGEDAEDHDTADDDSIIAPVRGKRQLIAIRQ